jgi:rod shape-determining protein MreD
MATRSYTSRRELEEYHFGAAATILVPLGLILAEAYLPLIWFRLEILELPLVAVIFFAVSRRSPIWGALTGTAIGLLRDLLTGQPPGIYGIADAIIGYAAASIGVQVDVEALGTRALMSFVFCLLQSGLLYLIRRNLLGLSQGDHLFWLHELVRAGINVVVSVPLFMLLDRAKRRD